MAAEPRCIDQILSGQVWKNINQFEEPQPIASVAVKDDWFNLLRHLFVLITAGYLIVRHLTRQSSLSVRSSVVICVSLATIGGGMNWAFSQAVRDPMAFVVTAFTGLSAIMIILAVSGGLPECGVDTSFGSLNEITKWETASTTETRRRRADGSIERRVGAIGERKTISGDDLYGDPMNRIVNDIAEAEGGLNERTSNEPADLVIDSETSPNDKGCCRCCFGGAASADSDQYGQPGQSRKAGDALIALQDEFFLNLPTPQEIVSFPKVEFDDSSCRPPDVAVSLPKDVSPDEVIEEESKLKTIYDGLPVLPDNVQQAADVKEVDSFFELPNPSGLVKSPPENRRVGRKDRVVGDGRPVSRGYRTTRAPSLSRFSRHLLSGDEGKLGTDMVLKRHHSGETEMTLKMLGPPCLEPADDDEFLRSNLKSRVFRKGALCNKHGKRRNENEAFLENLHRMPAVYVGGRGEELTHRSCCRHLEKDKDSKADCKSQPAIRSRIPKKICIRLTDDSNGCHLKGCLEVDGGFPLLEKLLGAKTVGRVVDPSKGATEKHKPWELARFCLGVLLAFVTFISVVHSLLKISQFQKSQMFCSPLDTWDRRFVVPLPRSFAASDYRPAFEEANEATFKEHYHDVDSID